MSRLDLTALRYFGEAAACGSIRQAADRLHVTPSAVSRQIAKLEDRLHTTLMERRPEGVRLTEAGQLLAGEVDQIARMVDRIHSRLGDLEGLRRGTVSIRCMEGAVDTWVPAVISGFHARYPNIRFNVAVSNADQTIQGLIDGSCDLGITVKAPKRSEIGIVASRSVPLVALVGPGHPLAAKSSVKLPALLQYPLALPSAAFGVRRVLDQVFMARRMQPEEIFTTNSIAMTRALARQGIAATILPRFSAQHDIVNGHLLPIPFADESTMRAEVELCVRHGGLLTSASRELLRAMKDRFKELTGA